MSENKEKLIDEMVVDDDIKLVPADEAHCFKCGEKVEIKNAEVTEMSNGGWATKGKCSNCGSGVYTTKTKRGASN